MLPGLRKAGVRAYIGKKGARKAREGSTCHQVRDEGSQQEHAR